MYNHGTVWILWPVRTVHAKTLKELKNQKTKFTSAKLKNIYVVYNYVSHKLYHNQRTYNQLIWIYIALFAKFLATVSFFAEYGKRHTIKNHNCGYIVTQCSPDRLEQESLPIQQYSQVAQNPDDSTVKNGYNCPDTPEGIDKISFKGKLCWHISATR